jgi:hypothetical protein
VRIIPGEARELGPFATTWLAPTAATYGQENAVPLSLVPIPAQAPLTPAQFPELPETERMEDAVFLAPGRYIGELGAPDFCCRPGDSRDWYRVNLQPGQMVNLSIAMTGAANCRLSLYDPGGNKVGEIEGNGGLWHQAEQSGGWYVSVACLQATGIVRYELSIKISTAQTG